MRNLLQRFRETKDQVIEQVGSYDPMPNEREELLVALNFERIQFWLGEGTVASKPVARVFGMLLILFFKTFH